MKNNNILLVNPWIYDFAAYDFWIKPVGLLSVGNYLEMHGYKTYLIDCLDRFSPFAPKTKNKKYATGKFYRSVISKPDILKHVPRNYCRYGLPLDSFFQAMNEVPKPDVILVTSMMTYWYLGVQYVIQLLKEKYPSVPIILGGIYATLYQNHAQNFCGADFVVSGPGEVEVLKLVNFLTGNEHIQADDTEIFPKPSYSYYRRLFSVPVLTSVGCPYSCSFCASSILSGKFRQRNPRLVFEEIYFSYFKKHVRHFAFYDDALLINHQKHISIILEEIINKKINLFFHTPNAIHPREITSELAQKIYRSNFKTLRLSYESIDKTRQQEMGLKITDEYLNRAIQNLAHAGYHRREIDVYVIMGLPNQTVDEVIESMLFVTSLGVKVRLTSFSPIPGTKDWERSIELCGMPKDIDPLLTNNSIYPLNHDDFNYDSFQQLRHFSKVLNIGIDHGINFFDQSQLAKTVRKSILNHSSLFLNRED